MRNLLLKANSILLVILVASHSLAQESPFGDLASPFGDEPTADAGIDSVFGEAATQQGTADQSAEDVAPGPLVTQLIEHAGRGNLQLAQAVASLARIGNWKQVDRLLGVAEGRTIAAAEMAQMARQIGPAILLRIDLHSEVGEKARAAVKKFSAAAMTEAESPDRLRRAIDGLDAPSVDNRLASARALLGGGNAAIAELVAAIVSENPPAPRDELLRAMLKLGDGGWQALRQLALYGQPGVRAGALQALARIDATASVPELITALHASDSTATEVETASTILESLASQSPSREATVASLFGDLNRYRQAARQTGNDDRVRTAWSVDTNRTGVTHQPTKEIMLAYRDVADAASRLRRIGGLSNELERNVMSADLAYRLMVDPDWGDPEQIQEIRSAFGASASGDMLLASIADSLQRDDLPSLLGLIRLIDPDAPADQTSVYLRGSGSNPTPLVAAALSPAPVVRYEAALKVGQLAGSARFPGSSQVRRTLSEMRSLGALPTAILVETRPEVIVSQQSILGRLGLEAEVVGSVAQLQRAVASGGDLRMIVSKTDLADLTPIEMLDAVRRIDRGRDIPIAFYGDEVLGLQPSRWQAPAVMIDQPISPAAFAGILADVEAGQRLPPLSAIDRQLYAEQASDLLAKMGPTR
jgi:hypothetical protein